MVKLFACDGAKDDGGRQGEDKDEVDGKLGDTEVASDKRTHRERRW